MDELLINAIKILAASSDEQREWLKKTGSFPCTDEIALLFDDAYLHFEAQEVNLLTSSISSKLKNINTILDVLSDSSDKKAWDEKSLDDQSWTELRRIAMSIIEELSR